MTRRSSFAQTAFAYLVVTFGFAYTWHLVAFASFYNRIGYFGDTEPRVELGFLTILIQALVIAYAYPWFQRGGRALTEGLRVASVFGTIIAAVQVIAAAAKNHAPTTSEWFLFEGLYFLIQFILIGLAFAWIHRTKSSPTE